MGPRPPARAIAMACPAFVLMAAGVLVGAGGSVRATAGASAAPAQDAAGVALYGGIRAFALTGGSAEVSGLTLARDRVEMTFTGTFYFAAPVEGRVTGAVFVGQGALRADVPPSEFERDHVRRMIGAELVDTDFRTAVLRWSDDTFAAIGAARRDGGAVPAQAARLAAEFDGRFVQETGANLPARLTASILNGEAPGVFVAQVDGGRRGRVSCVLDRQGRIPVGSFTLNGGEKGVIFAWQAGLYLNDVWMAFYGADDYARGTVEYSDVHDLVDVEHYDLNIDLRDGRRRLACTARMRMRARADGVRAVPFRVGESLPVRQDLRLRRQLRVTSAHVGGEPVPVIQEDWEGGFTVLLPKPASRGESIALDVALDGEFMVDVPTIPGVAYPIDNVTWLPRHGYLDRATVDLTFVHRRLDRIATLGTRVSEAAAGDTRDVFETRYRMTEPVALVVFALGPFERRTQTVTWEAGGTPTPLEFHSVPARVTMAARPTAIRHEFILAELDNAVRYFAALFGPYPYASFGAAFHPYNFGQGFPSLLMIPPADTESPATHAFIAHETAHQWWGNIVAWRSYRDQWLSEGFAEHSAILYAGRRARDGARAAADLVREARERLRLPPRTALGVGSGRLNDIGPVILGLRLHSSRSYGAYQALIYSKGALVLRMLQFLLSNPANGDDTAFVAMMKAFVDRHRNGVATTEEFAALAGQHFARTPIAQKFGLRDLTWFFRQWVWGTGLPSYTLEYTLAPQPGGGLLARGVVRQDGVGPDWLMVLPIVFSFDGNQEARTTVRASGASTPFEIGLPAKPRRVELDPQGWVLSERTVTKGQ